MIGAATVLRAAPAVASRKWRNGYATVSRWLVLRHPLIWRSRIFFAACVFLIGGATACVAGALVADDPSNVWTGPEADFAVFAARTLGLVACLFWARRQLLNSCGELNWARQVIVIGLNAASLILILLPAEIYELAVAQHVASVITPEKASEMKRRYQSMQNISCDDIPGNKKLQELAGELVADMQLFSPSFDKVSVFRKDDSISYLCALRLDERVYRGRIVANAESYVAQLKFIIERQQRLAASDPVEVLLIHWTFLASLFSGLLALWLLSTPEARWRRRLCRVGIAHVPRLRLPRARLFGRFERAQTQLHSAELAFCGPCFILFLLITVPIVWLFYYKSPDIDWVALGLEIMYWVACGSLMIRFGQYRSQFSRRFVRHSCAIICFYGLVPFITAAILYRIDASSTLARVQDFREINLMCSVLFLHLGLAIIAGLLAGILNTFIAIALWLISLVIATVALVYPQAIFLVWCVCGVFSSLFAYRSKAPSRMMVALAAMLITSAVPAVCAFKDVLISSLFGDMSDWRMPAPPVICYVCVWLAALTACIIVLRLSALRVFYRHRYEPARE